MFRRELREPFGEGFSAIELPVPVVGADVVEKPLGLFGRAEIVVKQVVGVPVDQYGAEIEDDVLDQREYF